MALTVVQTQNLQPCAVTGAIAQASSNTTAVVSGTEMDARQWKSVCYTASVITNDVKWSIFGGNVSDYSDEVAVLAATSIVAGAANSYTVSPAPYGFYRAKCLDTVLNSHGTITINGLVKAG